MFDDELLELIFSDEEIRTVPIGFQSTVIHAIDKILLENGYEIRKKEV